MTHFNIPNFFHLLTLKHGSRNNYMLKPLLKMKVKQNLSWTHYLTMGSVGKHFLVLETTYMKEKKVFLTE